MELKGPPSRQYNKLWGVKLSPIVVAQSAPRYLQQGYKNDGWRQEGDLATKATTKNIHERTPAYESGNDPVR